MVGAQHGAEVAHHIGAALNAVFVKVVTEQVHAVRAGQIVERVAIQIRHGDACARLHKRSHLQALGSQFAKLKRQSVGADELQIGQHLCRFRRGTQAFRKALLKLHHQRGKSGLAAFHHICWRPVHGKGLGLVVGIAGQQRRHAPGGAGMPGQRAVFGQRQLNPGLGFLYRHEQRSAAHGVERQSIQTN